MSKTVAEAVGTATVLKPEGGVVESQEKVGLVIKDGPVSEIGCELSFTKNLGNYQSVRMQVSLKAPSNTDPESLDKTYDFVKTWCDAKLTALREEIEETLKKA